MFLYGSLIKTIQQQIAHESLDLQASQAFRRTRRGCHCDARWSRVLYSLSGSKITRIDPSRKTRIPKLLRICCWSCRSNIRPNNLKDSSWETPGHMTLYMHSLNHCTPDSFYYFGPALSDVRCSYHSSQSQWNLILWPNWQIQQNILFLLIPPWCQRGNLSEQQQEFTVQSEFRLDESITLYATSHRCTSWSQMRCTGLLTRETEG